MKRYQYNVTDNILEVTDEDIKECTPYIQRADCRNEEILEIIASTDRQAKLLVVGYLTDKVINLKKISAFYKGRVSDVKDVEVCGLSEPEMEM